MAASKSSAKSWYEQKWEERNRTRPVDLPADVVKVVRSMARQWPRESRQRLLVTHDVDGTGTVFVTDSVVLREYQRESSVAVALQQVASVVHAHRFALRVALAGKAHPVQELPAHTGLTPSAEGIRALYPDSTLLPVYVNGLDDLEVQQDGVGLTRFWVDNEHNVCVASDRLAPFGGIASYGVDRDGNGYSLFATSSHKPIVVRSAATNRNLGLIMPVRVINQDSWQVGADGVVYSPSHRSAFR